MGLPVSVATGNSLTAAPGNCSADGSDAVRKIGSKDAGCRMKPRSLAVRSVSRAVSSDSVQGVSPFDVYSNGTPLRFSVSKRHSSLVSWRYDGLTTLALIQHVRVLRRSLKPERSVCGVGGPDLRTRGTHFSATASAFSFGKAIDGAYTAASDFESANHRRLFCPFFPLPENPKLTTAYQNVVQDNACGHPGRLDRHRA